MCIDKKDRVKAKYPGVPQILIPYKEKPLLKHHLEQLSKFDVCLNVRQSEVQFFEDYKLPLLTERSSVGDAGTIKRFAGELGYRFLVVRGGIFHNIDFLEMVTLNQGTTIMAVADIAEKGEPGIIVKGKGNHVLGFSDRRLVDCGAYCMYQKVADYIKEGYSQDIYTELIPRLLKDKELYYYEHKGAWEKIGG